MLCMEREPILNEFVSLTSNMYRAGLSCMIAGHQKLWSRMRSQRELLKEANTDLRKKTSIPLPDRNVLSVHHFNEHAGTTYKNRVFGEAGCDLVPDNGQFSYPDSIPSRILIPNTPRTLYSGGLIGLWITMVYQPWKWDVISRMKTVRGCYHQRTPWLCHLVRWTELGDLRPRTESPLADIDGDIPLPRIPRAALLRG